jgi:hypothetical protein
MCLGLVQKSQTFFVSIEVVVLTVTLVVLIVSRFTPGKTGANKGF